MKQDLIYDVGMNNGDDTAYYLHRGFKVVGIEADPALVEQTSQRFEEDIAAGRLTILNIGVSDREGSLPFWISDVHPEWNSFDRSIASRDGVPHHQISINCRRFQSVLEQYGTPYFLKLDIEGSEIHCLHDLNSEDLPKYVSFEKTERWTIESVDLLAKLGYTGSKLISQTNFLPVEYPPTADQKRYERSYNRLTSKNIFLRVLRKAGARAIRLLVSLSGRDPKLDGRFPPAVQAPFAEATPGKWQSFDEILKTLENANASSSAGEPSIFWGEKDYSFWADFHVRRAD